MYCMMYMRTLLPSQFFYKCKMVYKKHADKEEMISGSSQSKEETHGQGTAIRCDKFCNKKKHGVYKSSVEMHRLIIACRPEEAWRRE